jgi:hypothetical protein
MLAIVDDRSPVPPAPTFELFGDNAGVTPETFIARFLL